MHPIYLRKSDSPTVRQNDYKQGKTSHQFEVIRLWEQPSEPLLKAPGLFPFAILAQSAAHGLGDRQLGTNLN